MNPRNTFDIAAVSTKRSFFFLELLTLPFLYPRHPRDTSIKPINISNYQLFSITIISSVISHQT